MYGTTGQKMLVIKDIDEKAVRKDLESLREKGIDSIAVVLAHSYTYRDHEVKIGKIAEELGNVFFLFYFYIAEVKVTMFLLKIILFNFILTIFHEIT